MTQNTQNTLAGKVVQITAKKAEELLAKNGVNRPLSLKRVTRYADAMRKGQWQLNGEPIIVSENGRLMEGQHRLSAVIESGVESIPMYVITGTSEDTFKTLGSGAARTAADWFKIRGETHYAHLAATLTRLWFYETSGGMSMHNSGSDATPSKTDLDDLLDKFPKIRDSVEFCCKAENNTASLALPATITAACHYVFSKTRAPGGKTKADDFVSKLATGEEMSRNHPVMLLRKKLMERKRATHEKINLQAVVYLVFRAWVAFVKGEQLEKLQLPRSGDYTLKLA